MRPDAPLRIFRYREGVHFQVPPEVIERHGRPTMIPLLEGADHEGGCPQGGFVDVATPEEADYVVFPYVLAPFLMTLRAMAVHFFLRELPHFQSHERKHVFVHNHDRGHPLFTHALVLSDSPNRFNANDPFQGTLVQPPGGHVARRAPDFDFEKIEFDTNFVGTLSWPARYLLAQSVGETQGLRALLRHPDTFDWSSRETSYLHMDDLARKQALETLFVDAMRRSWTTLCPRGVGSSSVRFYEVLCMGRIPVHISDAYVLPYEDEIDYAEFCLFIPEVDAERCGPILRDWLGKHDRNSREAMCRKARQTWERWFCPGDAGKRCLELLRRHLPRVRRREEPRLRCVPGPLAGETKPRLATPPGFYAGMPLDDKKLWMNAGLEAALASRQDPRSPVFGVASTIASDALLGLLELARGVPENGTVACSGAPSGVLAVLLANGLLQAGTCSSLVVGLEDFSGGASPDTGRDAFQAAVRAARVEHLVRTADGRGPAEFRDGAVDLAVLADPAPETLPDTLAAWLAKLAPGGRLALLPESLRAVRAQAVKFAQANGLAVDVRPDRSLIILGGPTDAGEKEARGRRAGTAPSSARSPGVSSGRAPAGDGLGYLAMRATGGMGNRLLGVLCGVVSCLMTGRRLYVDWSDFMYSDRGENAFPRLFKLQGVEHTLRTPPDRDVYPECWQGALGSNRLMEQLGIDHHDPAIMAATRIALDRDYDQEVAVLWSYDLAPMRSALAHIRDRLPRFAHLDEDGICGRIMKEHILPRPAVTERVEAFAAARFTEPMVGVHVRHTDLRMPLEETVRVVAGLKAELGARVFLATDNPAVERTLSQLFGRDLVVMPKGYPDAGKHLHSHRVPGVSNSEKALEAAVEMYLLARCDAIVRYRPSSFARISWYCSDLPAGRVVCVQ